MKQGADYSARNSSFLQFLLGQLKPKNILEIGAAIGFLQA